MNLEERVLKLVQETIKNENVSAEYIPGIKLDKDFSFDSLMIIALITTIEDEFDFEFDFDEFDIENIYDLDEIINNVRNNTEKSSI